MAHFARPFAVLIAFLLLAAPDGTAQDKPTNVRDEPRTGVVVTVNAYASDVGAEVLRRGGNSIDAAVATAFVLAVTWPEAGNIGGGGFLLVHPGKGRRPIVFDFRETAPSAATKDMLAKPADRTPDRRVGVPGTVRGLFLAHSKLGKLPWNELLEPAIRLAREGYLLNAAGARSINGMLKRLPGDRFAETKRVFGKPNGKEWQQGDRLVQPDLGRTLARIAADGPNGFYAGPTAELIVAEMKRAGGLITRDDLANYRAIERQPIHGTYRNYDVYGVPPPSSGGAILMEMLNILETFDLRKEGRWSPQVLHLMAETMKRAYRDRARYLGDPDFVKNPAVLLDKSYAKGLAATIDRAKATPGKDLAGDIPVQSEGDHTTQISIVDRDAMAVSLTYTLENSFGGKIVVKDAGFFLNDEMNDFNPVPGVTDTAGQIGTPANQIEPGKRMLSSMCPTIIAKDGRSLLITGSPGGRTIINTVLCVVVNAIDFDMDIQAAVDAPRMHHPWFPDQLLVEPSLFIDHADTISAIKHMGHDVVVETSQGDAHSIWIDLRTGKTTGAADHRISGKTSYAPAE